jgi:uncharacterized protein (TIGR02301 family)
MSAMRRAATLLIASVLALPASALAQERAPAARQTLIDLAYILGEAHGLRQVCSLGDQHWRGRMLAMVDTENSDHGFAERLRQNFNTGYVARQSQFTVCSPESRKAESDVAARGAALARRMAQLRIPVAPPPDSVAEGRAPG